MTHTDELAFLDALGAGSISLIYNAFIDPEKMRIVSLDPVGKDPCDANLSILNSSIDCRPLYHFVEKASVYTVDLLESEVIQFNRCVVTKTWLKNGRLWYEEKTRSGSKRRDFVRWADSVLGWIRKSYEVGEDGRYIGPHAREQAKRGDPSALTKNDPPALIKNDPHEEQHLFRSKPGSGRLASAARGIELRVFRKAPPSSETLR